MQEVVSSDLTAPTISFQLPIADFQVFALHEPPPSSRSRREEAHFNFRLPIFELSNAECRMPNAECPEFMAPIRVQKQVSASPLNLNPNLNLNLNLRDEIRTRIKIKITITITITTPGFMVPMRVQKQMKAPHERV